MKYFPTVLLVIYLIISSCASSNSYSSRDDSTSPDQMQNPDPLIHLADHLRSVPGVRVEGSGDEAIITINGIRTFEGRTDPLYIVDGQQFNGDFKELAQMINPVEISSIQVLKNPTDLARYGVQGANGVIRINMKD